MSTEAYKDKTAPTKLLLSKLLAMVLTVLMVYIEMPILGLSDDETPVTKLLLSLVVFILVVIISTLVSYMESLEKEIAAGDYKPWGYLLMPFIFIGLSELQLIIVGISVIRGFDAGIF